MLTEREKKRTITLALFYYLQYDLTITLTTIQLNGV